MNRIKKSNLLMKHLVDVTDLFEVVFNTAIGWREIEYHPVDEDGDCDEIYFWYLVNDHILGQDCYDYLKSIGGNSIAFHEYKDKVYIGFTWYGAHWSNVKDFQDLSCKVIPDSWIEE